MTNFLTTEELLAEIKRQKVTSDSKRYKKFSKKNKFKLNKKHIFGSIVIIAVLHLVFMALPLILGDSTKDILGYQYEIVIDKNQELDEEIIGQVLRIKPIEFEDLEIGENVLIYGLYGNNYYWEVEVLEINQTDQTISATFDDVIRNTYHIDDVKGQIAGDSNFIGTFYYTASTIRGFIPMVLLHSIIVYATYYFMYQNKKKIIEKGELDEK